MEHSEQLNGSWFVPPGLKRCGHEIDFFCACCFYGEDYAKVRYQYRDIAADLEATTMNLDLTGTGTLTPPY